MGLKRVFDFSLALVGLVVSFPVWALFIFAIWLEDGLPIFFIQERVGKEGRIFRGFKFRSMMLDAEKRKGPVQALEHDERVTRAGKIFRASAMDELPQLLNILKGEMSFVGPRALRPVEIDIEDGVARSIFEFAGFKERSKVIPGLTGAAQIFAPRDISRREKFKFDAWYIRHQSFRLDLYLILLSFLITFKAKWEARSDKFSRLGRRLKLRIEKELQYTPTPIGN